MTRQNPTINVLTPLTDISKPIRGCDVGTFELVYSIAVPVNAYIRFLSMMAREFDLTRKFISPTSDMNIAWGFEYESRLIKDNIERRFRRGLQSVEANHDSERKIIEKDLGHIYIDWLTRLKHFAYPHNLERTELARASLHQDYSKYAPQHQN